MPKFMLQVSYTKDGVKGLVKDGGTKRRAAAAKLTESLGGKIEAFYFAFGSTDAILIVDVPSHVDAAVAALIVNSTGMITTKTTLLMTPEDVDQAAKKAAGATYSAPGQ